MSSNPTYGDIYDHKTFRQYATVTDLYTTGHGPTVGIAVTDSSGTYNTEMHVEMFDRTYTKRK
ncbi:hypothetical protein ACWERY_02145 [Streptomyces sp. NPDC004082]